MGRLAYILDALEKKPTAEQLITESSSKSEQRMSNLEQSISNLTAQLGQLQADLRAYSGTLAKGIGDSRIDAQKRAESALSAFTEGNNSLSEVIRQELKTIIDTRTDRTDEVLEKMTQINNEDTLKAMNDLEMITLLAINNIPKPEKPEKVDLKPVLDAIKKLEKQEKPRKDVEFSVVSDEFGFPQKVIAKEK